jgi:hypothetical protein
MNFTRIAPLSPCDFGINRREILICLFSKDFVFNLQRLVEYPGIHFLGLLDLVHAIGPILH